MSDQQISALKDQLASLTPQEKLELARFLTEQVDSSSTSVTPGTWATNADPNTPALKRAQHLAWLKAHREEYAGKYVALDGDQLVGSGLSIREAHEQARRGGIDHPFLVHVSSVNDAPFGGW
ncbi:MAG TPA: DUF5678 domain-containing protein [Blastocatellia bacterium]|nr:DUF5678 domain-containing protein [Blastocatellia bacterium]